MANTKQLRLRLPKYILGLLADHLSEEGLSSSKFMQRVCEEFLVFYDAMSEDEWDTYTLYSVPNDSGEQFSPYIQVETKKRMDEIAEDYNVGYMHAYWTAILKYMQRYNLFEREYDQTPGVIKIVLLSAQVRLMKHWVVDEKFPSLTAIYELAIERWLRKREAYNGPFFIDYEARPTDAGEGDEWASPVIAIPMSLHSAMSMWANKDSQSIRTIAYNALVEFMDEMLDPDFDPYEGVSRQQDSPDEGRPR